jgi:large subunit ribosomal protein L4
VALGPKPRTYKVSINKKVKKIAAISALSAKVAAGEMIVVDKIEAAEYKTKTMVAMLSAIGASKKTLVVLPEVDAKVIKSFANIEGVKTTQASNVNVYDILNCDSFVVVSDAAKKLEEVYA